MDLKRNLNAVFCIVVLIIQGRFCGPTPNSGPTDAHNYKVVCYYGTWAVYRPDAGKFSVEDIDPFICTHVIYAFAGLGFDNKIRSLDPYLDLEENYGRGFFNRFTKLKEKNPKLKTLLAIGGWNEGSTRYSAMSASSESRRAFAESCVEMLTKHNFDGLDMDWEYPAARGGKPEDKQNFVLLLKDLKEAFEPRGLLLTAAVSAGKHFIDPAYDIPQVAKYLDFINVMCYDYHGGWETIADHHAGLYPRPQDTEDNKKLVVDFSVNYWIQQGAPPEKIILGMGLYGRSFTLRKAEEHCIGCEAPQRGAQGPYTREPGSLGYNEICEFQQKEKWEIRWEPHYMAPYAYKERQWVGYDSVQSIKLKVFYARSKKLGGGMVWSIETDDFRGSCHGQKFPLLTAINEAFTVDNYPLPLPPTSPISQPTTQTTGESSSSTSGWWSPPTTPPTSPTTTTSTTTTTTTSPQHFPTSPPTKPTPSGGEDSTSICPNSGVFPHPKDCRKFISCVRIDQGETTYQVFEFSCPENTWFDPSIKGCSHMDGPCS